MIEIIANPFPTHAALRALWSDAWGRAGPDSFEPVLKRSLAHFGAFDGPALIGFVNVAWDGGGHAFVLDTCVAPAYRRLGVATRLIAAARQAALVAGAEWLHVDFEPHLATFYAKCGFVPSAAGLIKLR
ncbi:GNAT family N-acetyltransferase [Devosia algicola]|uniref:GNAT family N-acetyltransferase n=1 Tax=Devosia algicola TaxID=3026418 RepID=A0ABY7YRR2_9HYPH|nr:GNAT family N-acetyltransferase [Devosia algicola]WDR04013.1 GNAT family N-acetyltransferase [Devosia algicola]